MNDERVDRMAYGLASAMSRRTLGALTGGALATLGLAATADAKKKKKKKKKKPVPPTGCTPENQATTCAGGKCGQATNNCGEKVECGVCNTYAWERTIGSPGIKDGEIHGPRGVAVDGDGNLYVADSSNGRVQKFSNDGQFLAKFGTPGSSVVLSAPRGVAVDQQGNIFVADTGNLRMVKLNRNGELATTWDTAENAEDPVGFVEMVSIDANNTVYVGSGHRVLMFSTSGDFVDQLQASFVAVTSAAKNNTLYVVDAWVNRVYRFPGSYFGGTGSGDGEFAGPSTVTLDADGNIFVTDSQNSRFQKFDRDGNFLLSIGPPIGANGQMDLPLGIAVDAAGNVFVADSTGDRIQKFRPARD